MGTIVLRGMAAEFCSESTERDADESSYGLVFTSDVMTGAIAGGKGSIQPPGDIDVLGY
jgi:nicotinamidase-related amidase